jgi:hypothetical protein
MILFNVMWNEFQEKVLKMSIDIPEVTITKGNCVPRDGKSLMIKIGKIQVSAFVHKGSVAYFWTAAAEYGHISKVCQGLKFFSG